MLFHMHAIQPITCYSTNYCSLDYIEVASLSVCGICLTKPLKGKTLHWSDQFEVTNHSLTFLRVSVFVYMCVCLCVCVWQWPLASNCLFPVQTNKAGEGEGEDGISLMYTYIYIYIYIHSVWSNQTNELSTMTQQQHTTVERQHELLTLVNWEENTRVYYSFS